MTRVLLASVFGLLTLFLQSSGNVFASDPDMEWAYKTANGKPLKMSVFLPDDYQSTAATRKYPAILFFHGGSWRAGEVNWHFPDCEYWSSRGMIAASVDYRLKDRDKVEVPIACVHDAKSAVRFLRENADVLKVDPDRIVAAGGSAGGQLAAALATITSTKSNDPADDLSVSCRPDAVVLYNPWFKCEAALSPPNFVTKDLPPFITFQGDQDQGIPVNEILAFHNSVEAKGNKSALLVGKGGKHGFCNGRNANNPFFYWSLEFADQFLVEAGILSGASTVEWPRGVEPLPTTGYQSYSKSLSFVSKFSPSRQLTATPQQKRAEEPELPIDPSMRKVLDKNGDNKVSLEESLAFQSIVFDNFDVDKDRYLTLDEFKVPPFFATADKDSDGKLSRKEYLAVHEGYFELLDSNDDGVLTGADKKWIETMNQGKPKRAESVANLRYEKLPLEAELSAQIDKDKNGKITKAEFLAQSSIQFEEHDENKDRFLGADEFERQGPFLLADKDADAKLSEKEFLGVCEGVFLGLDRNKDGELTAADTAGLNRGNETQTSKAGKKFPLPEHLKKAMDVNRDEKVTRGEFMNFRESQFAVLDKNANQSLTSTEYKHAPSFKNADKDKNQLLTKTEFLSIFKPHFPALDTNKDGVLTSADVK